MKISLILSVAFVASVLADQEWVDRNEAFLKENKEKVTKKNRRKNRRDPIDYHIVLLFGRTMLGIMQYLPHLKEVSF